MLEVNTMVGQKYQLESHPEKNGNGLTIHTVSTTKDVEGENNARVFKSDVKADDRADTRCGVGSCKPEGMNFCASIKSFVFFFSIMAIFTQSNTALLSSQITSLERQFKLSSTVSGTLLSCNEIGQLSVVLLMSHFGHIGHIPRILSSLSIFYSIAMLTVALPSFIKPYSLPTEPTSVNTTGQNNDRFCSAVNNTGDVTSEKIDTSTPSVMWALYIIGASIVVQGIGKGPRRSLSAAYVDNNIHDRVKTGVYLGTTVAASILGPSFAILIGSGVSSIPVDLSDTILKKTDPRWVGCWWLGFLIFGIVGIVVSLPVFLFPKRLRGAAPIIKNTDTVIEDSKSLILKVKGLFQSLVRVFKNPIFTFALIAICFVGFGVTAVVFFGPKYLQNQYNLPAWKANLIHGVTHLIVAMIGTFSGGWMTSRFKMNKLTCVKFLLFVNFCSFLANGSLIFLGCEDQKIYGLDATVPTLNSSQHKECFCDEKSFLPVCGSDDMNYLNPCVAQCWNKTESGDYAGCTNVKGGMVTTGMCDAGCFTNFILFMVLSLIQSLMGTQAIMPNYLLLMRSVDERDKSMAIGLMVFATSILGWLPGPIVYGSVIDRTCRVWENTGNSRGSCLIYFLEKLRYRFLGLETGVKFCSLIVFCFVLYLCKRESNKENESKTKETEETGTTEK